MTLGGLAEWKAATSTPNLSPRASPAGAASAWCLPGSIAETVQNVTKLRGAVTRIPAGSLPNDGKVIEDRRPIG